MLSALICSSEMYLIMCIILVLIVIIILLWSDLDAAKQGCEKIQRRLNIVSDQLLATQHDLSKIQQTQARLDPLEVGYDEKGWTGMKKLNMENYLSWQLRLEKLDTAITERLEPDSTININAIQRICRSLSLEVEGIITGTKVAYDALKKLACRFEWKGKAISEG